MIGKEERKREKQHLISRAFQTIGIFFFGIGIFNIFFIALPKPSWLTYRLMARLDPLLLLSICYLIVFGLALIIFWQPERESKPIVC